MKTLHSVQSIYFDDKLSFGVNFFGHRVFNALSMSLKNLSDEKHKLHIFFMNNSVQRGQNENFQQQLKQSHRFWKEEITDCVLRVMFKRSSLTSMTSIFTNASQNTSPH